MESMSLLSRGLVLLHYKLGVLKQHTFTTERFCGSGVRARLSCVLCSGSQRLQLGRPAGLHSHLEGGLGAQATEIYFLQFWGSDFQDQVPAR